MKTKRSLIVILSFLSTITFFSCEKDESKLEENGLTSEINEFIPEAILMVLDSLKMPINKGETPPHVEGAFFISPLILTSSNRPTDIIGKEYADYTVSLSSQNSNNLTITVKETTSFSEGTGEGSFIVGNKNNFTIFTKLLTVNKTKNDSFLSAKIYSGTMTERGIDDFHYSLIMLDDFGDPNNQYIEIGDGRVFIDKDSISGEIIEAKSMILSERTKENSLLLSQAEGSEN